TGPIEPAPSDVAPRLTNSHRVVWSADRDVQQFDGASLGTALVADAFPFPGFDLGNPDVSEEGRVVAEARRSALFRLGVRGVRLIYFGGGSLAGIGPLRGPGFDEPSYAYTGRSLVLSALTSSEGRLVLAVDQGDGPIAALTTGEPSPLGGTFESGPGVEQVHARGRAARSPPRGPRGSRAAPRLWPCPPATWATVRSTRCCAATNPGRASVLFRGSSSSA